jgi:hypothetical protein
MPDIEVRAGGQATTLYRVLRGGLHVLVVPAGLAGLAIDTEVTPYRRDLDIVTGAPGKATWIHNDSTGLAVLVRPDGHVAARGRRGSMHTVIGYLDGLFGESAAVPGPVRS